MPLSNIKEHFAYRAQRYESSARWVKDKNIFALIEELAGIKGQSRILDVATGTGIIASLFLGKASSVIGIDVTEEMFNQAITKLNFMVCAQAEYLPFRDNVFDLVTCRQGLQFMQALASITEMYRVCKDGGKIILVQLAAFGEEDKEHAFRIQMARQPVRMNCFVEEDLIDLLRKAGCKEIRSRPYFSYESINEWINNGALSLERQGEIKKLYYDAPLPFRKIHELKFVGGDIIDKMKIAIVCGYKSK